MFFYFAGGIVFEIAGYFLNDFGSRSEVVTCFSVEIYSRQDGMLPFPR